MSNNTALVRIEINGELGIFTAAALREQLLDALSSGKEVEVDLSQVTEIDSAGVQLLVAAQREAVLLDKSLRFSSHSQAVFDILELCNLTGHLGDPVLIHSQT